MGSVMKLVARGAVVASVELRVVVAVAKGEARAAVVAISAKVGVG